MGDVYKANLCCSTTPAVVKDSQMIPVSITNYRSTSSKIVGSNPCQGMGDATARTNQKCFADSVVDAVSATFSDISDVTSPFAVGPQSGANVTKGFVGGFDTSTIMSGNTSGIVPNQFPFRDGAAAANQGLGPLCPVNVHWHLGAEHLSRGQYDEHGKNPQNTGRPQPMGEYTAPAPRRLASDVRYGFACHHYDATDSKFTTEYDWKHCQDM